MDSMKDNTPTRVILIRRVIHFVMSGWLGFLYHFDPIMIKVKIIFCEIFGDVAKKSHLCTQNIYIYTITR